MNLSFSSFRKEVELPEQRRLFSSAFPENNGLPQETEAFYYRKFCMFPGLPTAYEYTARDDGGMAGYYAAIPFTYRIDGEDLIGGMVCDVMTAPRVQGRGVFTRLGAYSLDSMQKEGVDFVLGYPRRAAVIPGHLKVGWQIAFRLPLYVLPLRSNSILRSREAEMLAPAANLLMKAAHGALRLCAPAGDEELSVQEWAWQDFLENQNYAAFFDKWRLQHRNSLEKNEAYLRWRLGFQGVDYRIVSAHRGENLVGLSILRSCCPEGVPALAVMDLMIVEAENRVLPLLAQGWRRMAARTGDEVILTMISEYRAGSRSLWRLGFWRTPIVFSVILKCLSKRAREKVMPDTAHWDLMWIDCDDL